MKRLIYTAAVALPICCLCSSANAIGYRGGINGVFFAGTTGNTAIGRSGVIVAIGPFSKVNPPSGAQWNSRGDSNINILPPPPFGAP